MSHARPVPRRRALTLFASLAAGAVSLGLAGCGASSDPLSSPAGSGTAMAGKELVIGWGDVPESQILAEVYAGALNAAGITASTKPTIGSREVYVKTVQDGSIDVVPDYTGSLLLSLDPAATEASADEIAKALPKRLPEGIAILEPAKAENKDALVVTRATAAKYELTSIEDLAKVCSELVIGAPATFAERAHGLPGLKEKYGCEPKKLEPFADRGLILKALLTDQVQVADFGTATPSIADNDLVVLEDPKDNFIAQQVVPLVHSSTLPDAARSVLNDVSRKLTTDDLMNLNRAVSGNQKQSHADAAKAWLKEKGLAS
ncbi:ABC transporter substrate-binding protein [Sinomonas mesophila]|uniref:ABC transporter substrate-binding protein n=1 Tax=Sinomonas mesophila TaxID=1531955 RepID=UPI000986C375|nr:ABC transporter substrate-binding protein [Sinomonas mesophila]